MMIRRLLLLIRDVFVSYPTEYGLTPGRATATKKILDQSSHPRPLNKRLRNDVRSNTIQVSGRNANAHK